MTREYYETINEILYNRERRSRKAELPVLTRFQVGDHVSFVFLGVRRYGYITNSKTVKGLTYYHIESESGTWYRNIYQGELTKIQ